MNIDWAGDWRCWDNLEDVTLVYTAKTGDVREAATPAKRRALTRKELAASMGAYTSEDVAFLFPGERLEHGQPYAGCKVIDAEGETYLVLEAQGGRRTPLLKGAGGYATWKTVCRNPVIHFALRDVIVIEAPDLVVDAAGVEVRDRWRNAYAGLRAKVVKTDEAVVDERGIHGFRGTHVVYVEKEVAVDATMRIPWAAARSGYLEIAGYKPAAQLGTLPLIDAVEAP